VTPSMGLSTRARRAPHSLSLDQPPAQRLEANSQSRAFFLGELFGRQRGDRLMHSLLAFFPRREFHRCVFKASGVCGRRSPTQPRPRCAIATRSPEYQQGSHPANNNPNSAAACFWVMCVSWTSCRILTDPAPLLTSQLLSRFPPCSIKAEFSTLRKEELLMLRLHGAWNPDVRF